MSERASFPRDAADMVSREQWAPDTPLSSGDEASTRVVMCPYCHSQDVALLALCGAQLLTDQYYCNACHTPFEHVRDA